jgi:hypothetical protein
MANNKKPEDNRTKADNKALESKALEEVRKTQETETQEDTMESLLSPKDEADVEADFDYTVLTDNTYQRTLPRISSWANKQLVDKKQKSGRPAPVFRALLSGDCKKIRKAEEKYIERMISRDKELNCG